MTSDDRNGTLDFPGGDGLWGRNNLEDARISNDHSGSNPTFMISKGAGESTGRGYACPKCGASYSAGEDFCRNCGTTLRQKKIVDMRHTLDSGSGAGGRPPSSGGVEVQRMKTSYKSGVLGARTEREGISPMPTPSFPQMQQQKKRRGEEGHKYNVIMAISIIAFITIMIVVLIILIASYL